MIEFKNCNVQIEDKHLFSIKNWKIEKGNVYYLLGKNGAGKSTFLHALLEDISFQYLLDGKPRSQYDSKEISRKVAYVTSKIVANNFTTVEEFIKMGRYPYPSNFFSADVITTSLIAETVHLLEISSLLPKMLSKLSDGQQQLVAIARALVQQTDFLLMDEPTAFLDYSNKMKIFNLIQRLAREQNKGIIFVTHDLELIFQNKIQLIHYVDVVDGELKFIELNELSTIENVASIIYNFES